MSVWGRGRGRRRERESGGGANVHVCVWQIHTCCCMCECEHVCVCAQHVVHMIPLVSSDNDPMSLGSRFKHNTGTLVQHDPLVFNSHLNTS